MGAGGAGARWRERDACGVASFSLALSSSTLPPLSLSIPLDRLGYFRCDPASRIGRPSSLADLRAQVTSFARVKAVGVGHSWDGAQFCAGTGSESLGLVLTEFPEVLKLYTTPPAHYDLAGCNPATHLPFGGEKGQAPILVDPAARTVKVHGGVGTRMLIDFLAACPKASTGGAAGYGWALPAIPWYIDQTIGGAVATATHGSSFTYGSLSNQLVALELMTADGALLPLSLADPDGGHLFRAARASVGRLGVLYSLTFAIVPQEAVERTKRRMTVEQMAAEVTAVQDAYNAAVTGGGDPAEVAAALAPLDNTQFFFFAKANEAWRLDFRTLGKLEDAKARSGEALVAEGKKAAQEQGANLVAVLGVLAAKAKVGAAGAALFDLVSGKLDGEARQNATYLGKEGLSLVPTKPVDMLKSKLELHSGLPDPKVAAQTYGVGLKLDAETRLAGAHGSSEGVFEQYPKSVALPPNGLWVTDAFNSTFDAVMRVVQGTNMLPGVFASRDAYPSQACPQSVSLADLNGYDQYEAAIPFARAGSCLTAVAELLNGPAAARFGFRTSPLVRFVGADDAYISMTQGTPTMFLNLEDHRECWWMEREMGEGGGGAQALAAQVGGVGGRASFHPLNSSRLPFSRFPLPLPLPLHPPPSVSYNTGPGDGSPLDSARSQNPGFWLVMDYLVHGPACGGRLHWGKAGWPTLLPDWNPVNVTTGYPATWCDFGCAVEALDPGGKFQTTSPVWRWGAELSGSGGAATLADCCGAGGFNATACVCTPPPL